MTEAKGKDHVLGAAKAGIGTTPYAVSIEAGRHRLTADEPVRVGGQDAGPSPFNLLLSALGACTAATLKMYAERKDWPLEALDVSLTFIRGEQGDRIERQLDPKGPLDEAQRQRLADIAERTPVTLVLKSGIVIDTRLVEGGEQ
jgi:putative redox protein